MIGVREQIMDYDGGNRETITERVGTFEDVTSKLEKAPYVTEWDDAKALQDKKKKPKFQKSTSEDIENTKDYISQINDSGFLNEITSQEILKKYIVRFLLFLFPYC